MNRWLLPILLSIFLVGGCSPAPDGGWINDSSSVALSPVSRPATDSRSVTTPGVLPDPTKTPGAYFPTIGVDDLSRPGYTARVRNVPESLKKKVFASYGIPWSDRSQYEVDHLIPLELGGSNDLKNLWPQSYAGRYGARLKDKLENKLHDLVCSSDLDLRQAQQEIASDWIASYEKRIGPFPTGASQAESEKMFSLSSPENTVVRPEAVVENPVTPKQPFWIQWFRVEKDLYEGVLSDGFIYRYRAKKEQGRWIYEQVSKSPSRTGTFSSGPGPQIGVLWSQVRSTPTTAVGYGITNGSTIDSWGTKTVPSGTIADLSTVQTFTSKTISGSSNTLTNISLTSAITGTLPVANGGTGITSFGTGVATALGNNVNATGGFDTIDGTATLTNKTLTSPTLTTPVLGTPSSGTLTNCTGLPISTGVSGLASGASAFLATPSSANLATLLTNETGSGAVVFATSPTLVTPILGTPSSGTLTSCTGLPLTTGVTGTLPAANGGTGTTSIGTSLSTSGSVLNAIQDIRTTASPSFLSLITVGTTDGSGIDLFKGHTSISDGSLPFTITSTVGTNVVASRGDHVIQIGTNVGTSKDITKSGVWVQLENHYETSPGVFQDEAFIIFRTPSNVERRALGMSCTEAGVISSTFAATQFTWTNEAGNSTYATLQSGVFFLPGPLVNTLNNSDALKQLNFAGNGYIALAKLNASDRLVLGNGAQEIVANKIRFSDSDATANLYRSAASTIKTDGNLYVTGTSTLHGAVTADGGMTVASDLAIGGNFSVDGSAGFSCSSGFNIILAFPDASNNDERTLNFKLNDANKTIDLGGNITTAAAFTTSGANALTLTTTGATNVTLPTSGTLSTARAAISRINTASATLTNNTPYVYTGSGTTWTLPAGASGAWVGVKHAGSGTLVISRAGSDNIFDASAVTTVNMSAGDYKEFVWDGTNWNVQ